MFADVFPDPEQQDAYVKSLWDVPSQSIEIATSNEVINAESLSELLQLPVDEEVIPTQLSSSPVKPKRRTTPIQAADNELEKRSIMVYGVRHGIRLLELYFKCPLAKDESITLCKSYHVRTHDSNSTDRPRPVKIILGSVEEKQLLLNRRKVVFGNARLFFFTRATAGPNG